MMATTKAMLLCAPTVAFVLALLSISVRSQAAEETFGSVTVALRTTALPQEFAIGATGRLGYSTYTSIVLSLEIKVSGKSVYVPFDAFAGLGDPKSTDVKVLVRDRRWQLRLNGGDAASSYCAIMDFDSTQVHEVRLFGSCRDSVTFATKKYRKIKVLN
jgi:hypothetical protein